MKVFLLILTMFVYNGNDVEVTSHLSYYNSMEGCLANAYRATVAIGEAPDNEIELEEVICKAVTVSPPKNNKEGSGKDPMEKKT